MNLEGDALDTFTWVSSGRTIRYWEELVLVFQEQFGPVKLQNPNVHLCGINQTGSVAENKQEFETCSSRQALGCVKAQDFANIRRMMPHVDSRVTHFRRTSHRVIFL